MDLLTGPAEQRASEEEREWTVGVLRAHQAAGRLTAPELGDRSARAYAARTLGELRGALENLPIPAADKLTTAAMTSAQHALVSGRAHARNHRSQSDRTVRMIVISTAPVMAIMVGIWLFSGMGYTWFVWPLLGWTAAVAARLSSRLK